MDWTTAISDLRRKLSDGQTDKLRAFKKVIGRINGTNKIFKTYEFRRWTNFTNAAAPEGVYVNSVRLDVSGIVQDFPENGYFTLLDAPDINSEVEAVYYVRWFLDEELDEFLRVANNWLGFGDNYLTLNTGLRAAALDFAASEAYSKLAIRWAESQSDTYLLEDAPKENEKISKSSYLELSKFYREEAEKKRDDFYTRQGQSKAPLFATMTRGVGKVGPNR
jgi:hypothetical protein